MSPPVPPSPSADRHPADPIPAGLDPVDRLLLDEASAVVGRSGTAPQLVVIGDLSGALTLAAAQRFGVHRVRVFQDPLDAEQRLDALLDARQTAGAPSLEVFRAGLQPELLRGAGLILLRLPKHLAELSEITALAASHADESVRLVAAGRVKHMSHGMNEVLRQGFSRVTASLARQKSRALHASGPVREHGIPAFPRSAEVPELDVRVAAHGGAFAGPRLDVGTRALLASLEEGLISAGIGPDQAGTAVDLGCGTGLLAVGLARARPGMEVLATDRSWAACASARQTVAWAGLHGHITVLRDDAAASLPDGGTDLVLLNPPFHDGHGVATAAAHPLIIAAARLLRPGGTLLTVYNSSLRHRPALAALVGPTRQLARTSKFTVTASRIA